MKKKIGSLLLSVVLLVSMSAFGMLALTGCGGDKYDLYVAGLKGAYGEAHWTELVKGFEAKSGKKVKLRLEANIEETIQPEIQAGGGPDVIYLAKGRRLQLTEKMLESGQIMDLTSFLDEKVQDGGKTFNELIHADAKLGMKETDNKTYMIPLFVGLNGMYFDADKFYANDGDGVYSGMKDGKYELPNTWTEFKALGASLTDVNTVSLFTYPTPGYMDALIPASIATNAGTEKLDDCFNYVDNIWNDTKVNQIFKELAAIKPYIYPNCVENGMGDKNFVQNQQSVIDGKTLFMCNGDWVKGEMLATTPATFNWGTIPYLAFEDGQTRYSSTVYEQIYINKQTKQADLAKDFLKYVYSDAGQQIIAQHSRTAMVPTINYPTLAAGKIPAGALAGYAGYYDGSVKTISTNNWATPGATLPGNTPKMNDIVCGKLADVWKKTDSITADAWIAAIEALSDTYRNSITA